MKPFYLFLLLLPGIFVSCQDDDGKVIPTSANPAPAWTSGSPTVTPGATTADLVLETDRTSTVYFIVSGKEISILPDDLVQEAVTPTITSITHNGVQETGPGEPATFSIEDLNENKNYFAYFIARGENPAAGENVHRLMFSTNIRQDTLDFYSETESRDVSYLLYQPEGSFKQPEKNFPLYSFLPALERKPRSLTRSTLFKMDFSRNTFTKETMSLSW